ncbi:MAG TPA: hypothetical protein PK079_17210 [Leptospiraceae bacterium]|nr:hypothetical protein [Leptospiraceae bacterium]HMW05571.1 hypothetical protein [Leptospiraceae bacterium]HMX34227.1 hypothetical protein [Leptospiraceae bacterium]HMY31081.1 hypothetical protein [Leptospiraceae bacterium]HMZ65281.1 hypothetical protein [Leptospiraceae bacterium]
MSLATCKCNTDRNSPNAEEIRKYSKMSMFLLLFGVSAVPVSLEYKCKKCGEIFDRLSEEELKNYKY